jgi:predicted nucleic acid-binding protein
MASSDYSGLTCENSVSEVLKMANAELRELCAHYKTITQRIRRLRIVVEALGELGSPSAASEMGQKGPSLERGPHSSSGTVSRSRDSFRESNQSQAVKDEAERSLRRNSDLRRACRIALMETSEAVSRQEVYERIVRRGSFSFADTQIAASSILKELNALTERGELRCFEGSSGLLWQRVPASTELVDPVLS